MTKLCNECDMCMVKKVFPKDGSLQLMKPIPMTELFAKMGMDVLCLLEPTINGHGYTVVATDNFTKWVEPTTFDLERL